jgi:hypothetical protein
MYKVKPLEYGRLLMQGFESKSPILAYGGPGIGKTEVPRQIFRKHAESENLKYVEWSDLTIEEKRALIKNPKGYFVFCDQRIGQMDSTDLRGIPNMATPEILETMPMSWVVFFTQPDAKGVIFFDEINLAPPVVAGQAYQIINERTVADRRLADGVYIIAAGNRTQDKAFTFDMPFPLRDRFAEVEVEPDAEQWRIWASQNGVNSHLISFITWKESYLYKVVESGTDKSSTPRGIVRASKLIGDKDVLSPEVNMLVSVAVGEAFATEFQAYCKCYSQLDWGVIYKKPESVKNFSSDKNFAVVGGMTEHFVKSLKEKDKKAPVEMLTKITAVIPHMPADFVIICLRMMREANPDALKNAVKQTPNFMAIAKAYGKYIM